MTQCTLPGCLRPKETAQLIDAFGRLADRNIELRGFLVELLDPERFGHAVTPEVHERARQLLGIGGPRP